MVRLSLFDSRDEEQGCCELFLLDFFVNQKIFFSGIRSSEEATVVARTRATTAVVTRTSTQMWEGATRTPPTYSCAATKSTVPPSSANLRSIEETKVSIHHPHPVFHDMTASDMASVVCIALIPLNFPVILPTSALHELARLRIQYPMTFMISNSQMGIKTYCGVLEFSAEEGMCHIPIWMMNNLCVEEGSEIILRNMNLNKGTYVKI